MQQKSHRIAGMQWLLSCPLSQILNHRRISEQARDLAVDIDVHVLGGWMLRQARHRQDVARQRDDEAGAGADAELLDCDAETGRASDRPTANTASWPCRPASCRSRAPQSP